MFTSEDDNRKYVLYLIQLPFLLIISVFVDISHRLENVCGGDTAGSFIS